MKHVFYKKIETIFLSGLSGLVAETRCSTSGEVSSTARCSVSHVRDSAAMQTSFLTAMILLTALTISNSNCPPKFHYTYCEAFRVLLPFRRAVKLPAVNSRNHQFPLTANLYCS